MKSTVSSDREWMTVYSNNGTSFNSSDGLDVINDFGSVLQYTDILNVGEEQTFSIVSYKTKENLVNIKRQQDNDNGETINFFNNQHFNDNVIIQDNQNEKSVGTDNYCANTNLSIEIFDDSHYVEMIDKSNLLRKKKIKIYKVKKGNCQNLNY